MTICTTVEENFNNIAIKYWVQNNIILYFIQRGLRQCDSDDRWHWQPDLFDTDGGPNDGNQRYLHDRDPYHPTALYK